jgi:hypothetical protein
MCRAGLGVGTARMTTGLPTRLFCRAVSTRLLVAVLLCAPFAGELFAPTAAAAQGSGILQATYLGGSGHTDGRTAAIDPVIGDVLVAGAATVEDIAGTAGGAQASLAGAQDGWIARLNSNLRVVIQATYFGGGGVEQIDALAIDPSTGDVLVAGYTSSDDLPGTAGAAQPERAGATDAFVARFSADLTVLRQATYLGGSADEGGPALGLAIEARSGDVYVTGNTSSTDFPGRAGSAQPACSGTPCADGFVARLSGNLKTIRRSTYVGSTHEDNAYDIAIHPLTGDILIAGDSVGANLARAGVVTCYNSALTTLRGLNRVGTRAWGLVIDPVSGDVIAAGETSSALAGADDGAQPHFGGGNSDAFVARFNADLFLLQSTYLGGSQDDGGMVTPALEPDTGEIVVAGSTSSADFPATQGGAQAMPAGATEIFVARLAGDLSLLDQATYLGGMGNDAAARVRVTSDSTELVVAGSTSSTDFPATGDGAQAAVPTPATTDPSAAFAVRVGADLLAGPPTPTPTAPSTCAGDCGDDRQVTVDDLITGVNIALENLAVAVCTAFDRNGDGRVTVDELIGAVNSALDGCA